MAVLNILVTGAGSGVGQGILKALRISSLDLKIFMADIMPLNSALFRGDEAVIIPRVESENALETIVSILKKNQIDVLMIGSEFDLDFFSKNKAVIESLTKTLIIASPHETVRIANDKWLTAEFLKKNDLNYPESYLTSDLNSALAAAKNLGYPNILKTRTGTSSRHVHVVKGEADLKNLFSSVPNPMLQEMIATPKDSLECEYTCSVFKTAQGEILGPFTARRTLRGGSSWVIEVGHFENLYQPLLDIGKALPFMGSLNIQLMLGKNGAKPFEFNARFSGTTAVRAHYGFNEPAMTIRSYVLGEKITQPVIQTGLALRYLEEVFVENVTATSVIDGRIPKGFVRSWF